MRGIKKIEKVFVQLQPAVGAQKNQRRGKKGKNGPFHAQSEDCQAPRVERVAGPQGGYVAEAVQRGARRGMIAAEIEDEHQENAGGGIVEIPDGEQQKAEDKQPPPALLQARHSEQAEKQGKINVQIELFLLPVIGMSGKNIKGLADQCEDSQTFQIFFNVPRVEQPHRHTVAKEGESEPAGPPERGRLRKNAPPMWSMSMEIMAMSFNRSVSRLLFSRGPPAGISGGVFRSVLIREALAT